MKLKFKKGKDENVFSLPKNNGIGRPRVQYKEATEQELALLIKLHLQSPKGSDNMFAIFDNTLKELQDFVKEHLPEAKEKVIAKPSETTSAESETEAGTDQKKGKK